MLGHMDQPTSLTRVITTVTLINSTNRRFTGPTADIIPTPAIIAGIINIEASTSVITIARAAFISAPPVTTGVPTPALGHPCMEDSGHRSSLVIATRPSYRNVTSFFYLAFNSRLKKRRRYSSPRSGWTRAVHVQCALW